MDLSFHFERKSTKLAKADLSFLLCAAAHYSETADLHPAKICLLQDSSAGLEVGKKTRQKVKGELQQFRLY